MSSTDIGCTRFPVKKLPLKGSGDSHSNYLIMTDLLNPDLLKPDLLKTRHLFLRLPNYRLLHFFFALWMVYISINTPQIKTTHTVRDFALYIIHSTQILWYMPTMYTNIYVTQSFLSTTAIYTSRICITYSK
mgnify:CR=1 FL=1